MSKPIFVIAAQITTHHAYCEHLAKTHPGRKTKRLTQNHQLYDCGREPEVHLVGPLDTIPEAELREFSVLARSRQAILKRILDF